MTTRICPRCKRHLDEEIFFQDPVALCMVCYSNVPENIDCYDEDEQIWLRQLKEKALKSKWAKVRIRKAGNNKRTSLFGGSKRGGIPDALQRVGRLVQFQPMGAYKCSECGYDVEEFDRDHHNEKQCKDPIWRGMMEEPDNEEMGMKVKPVNPDGSTANPSDPLGILAKAKGKK